MAHEAKTVYTDQKLFKSLSKKNTWYWGCTANNKYKQDYLCSADPWTPGEEISIVQTKTSTRYMMEKSKFPEHLKSQHNIIFYEERGTQLQNQALASTPTPVNPPSTVTPVKETPLTIDFPKKIEITNQNLESIDSSLKELITRFDRYPELLKSIDEMKNSFIVACNQLSLLRNAILDRNNIPHTSSEEEEELELDIEEEEEEKNEGEDLMKKEPETKKRKTK